MDQNRGLEAVWAASDSMRVLVSGFGGSRAIVGNYMILKRHQTVLNIKNALESLYSRNTPLKAYFPLISTYAFLINPNGPLTRQAVQAMT